MIGLRAYKKFKQRFMDLYNVLSKVKISIFPQKRTKTQKSILENFFWPKSLSVCITLNLNSLSLSVEYCKIICLKKIKKQSTHCGSNILK